jgi:wobble nucleotide-excising tRNase
MLTRISIDKVASFKNEAILESNKKINILYGLNGSGKSTIGRFLRSPKDPLYEKCRIDGAEGAKIIVFNEDFIRENFFESPTVPGIFSLSKKNNDAENKIAAATQEKATLLSDFETSSNAYQTSKKALEEEQDQIIGKVFDIKRKYSGGDRVLDYCLDGVMSSKDKLYERLQSFHLASTAPLFTVKDLQEDARLLSASDATSPEPLLPLTKCNTLAIESSDDLKNPIIGATTNEFSEFINQLKHSDWVREGQKYIRDVENSKSTCPFCQEDTIDRVFIDKLQSYFDESYSEKLGKIRDLRDSYYSEKDAIQDYSAYRGQKFYDEQIDQIRRNLVSDLEKNLLLLDKKIESPSETVLLTQVGHIVSQLNDFISQVNGKTVDFNQRIANKKSELARIKENFWNLMRWEYDQSVSYVVNIDEKLKELTSIQQSDRASFQKKTSELNEEILDRQEIYD